MSEISSDDEEYKQDSRTPCKYADKCYQKNPSHLSKYKHPLKKSKRKHNTKLKPSKRVKINETTKAQGEQISDSPEEDEETNETVNEVEVRKKEVISSSDSEQEDAVLQKEKISDISEDVEDKRICIQSEADTTEEDSFLDESNKSEKEQEANVPAPSQSFDPKIFIKSRFLVEPPQDFYDFWEFCKELKPVVPTDALKNVGLTLVGPYDVLAGRFKHVKKTPDDYLRHWRFYYDPPEVLTVIKGDDKTGYHIGYFYDSPNEAPVFLVSNHGTKDGVFTKMGDNIFTAVSLYLEELRKVGDPFKKMHVGKLLSSIKTRAEKLGIDLSSHSQQMKKRHFKVVAKTFNKIGLVVPYNKKTQLGYRDLAMQDKELLILLNKLEKAAPEQKPKYLSDLQPVLTYANIALDECDFGTGVKLGWELLYHGIDSLNSTITQFLGNSYRLLNKEAFAKIAEAHMSNRKKGCDLSII